MPLQRIPRYTENARGHWETGGLRFFHFKESLGAHWEVADAIREIIQNWFDQASEANGFRPLQVTRETTANGSVVYTLLGSVQGMVLTDFQLDCIAEDYQLREYAAFDKSSGGRGRGSTARKSGGRKVVGKGLLKLGEARYEVIPDASGKIPAAAAPNAATDDDDDDDDEYTPAGEGKEGAKRAGASRGKGGKAPTGKQWRWKFDADDWPDGTTQHDKPHTRVTVINFGATTGRSILSMGSSTKASDDRLIGQHGDGMKVAFPVLARAKVTTEIQNGHERWFIGAHKKEMVYHVKRNKRRSPFDFSTILRGPHDTLDSFVGDVEGRFLAFLPASTRDLFVDVKDVRGGGHADGQILLAPGHEGKVFVKGVYVQTLKDLHYSVNLRGDFSVGRDRDAVDVDECSEAIANLWGDALLQESAMLDKNSGAGDDAAPSEPSAKRAKLDVAPTVAAAGTTVDPRVSNTMLKMLEQQEEEDRALDCVDCASEWNAKTCSTMSAAFIRKHGDGATPVTTKDYLGLTKALWELVAGGNEAAGAKYELVQTPKLLYKILIKGSHKTAKKRLGQEGQRLMEADSIGVGALSESEKAAWVHVCNQARLYDLCGETIAEVKDYSGCLAWRSGERVCVSKVLLSRNHDQLEETVRLLARHSCNERGESFEALLTKSMTRVIRSKYFPSDPATLATRGTPDEHVLPACSVCTEEKPTELCQRCKVSRCCGAECWKKHQASGCASMHTDGEHRTANDGDAAITTDTVPDSEEHASLGRGGTKATATPTTVSPSRRARRRKIGVPTDIEISEKEFRDDGTLYYKASMKWEGGTTEGFEWFPASELKALDNKIRAAGKEPPFIDDVMQRFDGFDGFGGDSGESDANSPDSGDDADVTKEMLQDDGRSLFFASESQKRDPELVGVAVMQDGLALKHADPEMKANRGVVAVAVSQNGLALEHAHVALKADRGVVEQAVAQDGRAIQFAVDPSGKMVLAAFMQDPTSPQLFAGGLEMLRQEVGLLRDLTLVEFFDVETGLTGKRQLSPKAAEESHRRRLASAPKMAQQQAAAVEQVGRIKQEKVAAEKAVAVAEQQLECVICMDAPRSMVLMNCAHFVACRDCAEGLKQCPICRDAVTSMVRVHT